MKCETVDLANLISGEVHLSGGRAAGAWRHKRCWARRLVDSENGRVLRLPAPFLSLFPLPSILSLSSFPSLPSLFLLPSLPLTAPRPPHSPHSPRSPHSLHSPHSSHSCYSLTPHLCRLDNKHLVWDGGEVTLGGGAPLCGGGEGGGVRVPVGALSLRNV